MKTTFRNLAIITLSIVITVAAIYGTIQWTKTISIWEKNADREVFKATDTYNEAAASFLADCYRQYNAAETKEDQNTIMQYVIMRYPNLNYNNIDNQTLRQFYKDCLNN